ncbi:MAG TPA: hypothetical protein H9702_09995 [Candidatus Merdibacter merdavium]|uniref:Uncharacterized protein n=1 Tax=Candidatus Merdibacter merdavium TaxID=2838692 RepID=A0A9D2NS53_9FIRM|nr:hypothetical protein [Candidatus Merdibacter merdavium]
MTPNGIAFFICLTLLSYAHYIIAELTIHTAMAEKPNPSDHFLAYMFPWFASCHFSVCRSCKTLIQVLTFRLIRLSVTCRLRGKNQRLWARAETRHNLRNTLFVAILTIFPPQKIFLHFLFVLMLL